MAIAGIVLWSLFPDWFGVNIPWGQRNSPNQEILEKRLKHPKEFSVHIYASDLKGARILRYTNAGDLLVSIPSSGKIVLLSRDNNHDGSPDGRKNLLTGLNKPHGMDFYNDWLYIAETDAIGRIRFNASSGETNGEFQRVVIDLPGGGDHWAKSVRFGPDGLMYVAVGSSCNVCIEEDPRRAAILRFRPDGSNGEIYATGLRNTEGFDWRPDTNEMYGVDNGRDFLGDHFPPCELNLIERGKFYGWPYANGDRVADPEFGDENVAKIEESMSPAHRFGAHTAPLNIVFLRSKFRAPRYRKAALVALHGSWNSSKKVGYKIVSLHYNTNGTITERPFLTGFEENDDVIGRPVDVVEGVKGRIFVSDDYSGTVYRIDYKSSIPEMIDNSNNMNTS